MGANGLSEAATDRQLLVLILPTSIVHFGSMGIGVRRSLDRRTVKGSSHEFSLGQKGRLFASEQRKGRFATQLTLQRSGVLNNKATCPRNNRLLLPIRQTILRDTRVYHNQTIAMIV